MNDPVERPPEARWRVGRSIGRTIYRIGGAQPLAIAVGEETEAVVIAARIVSLHNAAINAPESPSAAYQRGVARGREDQLRKDVEALRAESYDLNIAAFRGAAAHLERTFGAGVEPREEELSSSAARSGSPARDAGPTRQASTRGTRCASNAFTRRSPMADKSHAEDSMEGEVGEGRRVMPTTRHGRTHKFTIVDAEMGEQDGYLTINFFEDGEAGEVFLQGVGKEGSTLDGFVQWSMVLLSVALQFGAELPMLCRKMAHMKFGPRGNVIGHEAIPFCHSVPAYVAEYTAHLVGNHTLIQQLRTIREELRSQ